MSLMAPGDTSEGLSEGPELGGIDAWALCAEYVEQIVRAGEATAAREHPGGEIPRPDWDRIWRAGEGAPTDELAIGRIIRTASEEARALVRGTAASPSPTGQADAAGGEIGAGVALAEQTSTLGEPTALGKTGTAAVEPVTGVAEPATGVVEPVTTPADQPEFATDEPATASVLSGASVAGTTTLDRPERAPTVVVPTRPLAGEEPAVSPEATGETGPRTEAEHVAPDRSGWITAFTWIRNIGAVILLFVVWQLWGTAIAQHHAQDQLKGQFEAAVHSHRVPAAAAGGHLIPAGVDFPSPADGSVVARLQIPAIGVDQYVVSGTSETDLAKGPGHYVGTALPGQAGNVAIAGHRTTHGAPFNGLGHLVSGDRIVLTTTWGENLTYVVSGTPQAVSPNDVAVLNYFGDNRITLTTCNPEYSATQRLVAVGELKTPVATPAPPPKHITYHVVDPSTASWDWSLLPTVGIEVCLLLLLGLSYRRFGAWFGKVGMWLILVPVWAALLYVLFDTLTTFLPSSI